VRPAQRQSAARRGEARGTGWREVGGARGEGGRGEERIWEASAVVPPPGPGGSGLVSGVGGLRGERGGEASGAAGGRRSARQRGHRSDVAWRGGSQGGGGGGSRPGASLSDGLAPLGTR